MPQKRRWFLVMDAGRARLLQWEAGPQLLRQLYHFTNQALEATHCHGPDRPGRVFEAATTARHAYEAPTDWHEQQKLLFIEKICGFLQKAYEAKEYNSLYLIAPAKVLGHLRQYLAPPLLSILEKEIGKDLSAYSLEELQQYVEQEIL